MCHYVICGEVRLMIGFTDAQTEPATLTKHVMLLIQESKWQFIFPSAHHHFTPHTSTVTAVAWNIYCALFESLLSHKMTILIKQQNYRIYWNWYYLTSCTTCRMKMNKNYFSFFSPKRLLVIFFNCLFQHPGHSWCGLDRFCLCIRQPRQVRTSTLLQLQSNCSLWSMTEVFVTRYKCVIFPSVRH